MIIFPQHILMIEGDSEHKTVSITLQGTESALAAVNPNTITGVVDLGQLVAADDEEELRDGTYNAKVEWTLPNGLKAKGSTEVRLHVRKNN